jgi:hypothetical protein
MADLADADHFYGNDLAVTPSGDIALVTKSQRTIQRIIRRVMTVPTDARGCAYPWQPEYGVGLGARIGEALDSRGIQRDFRTQMRLEASVQQVPSPVVTVDELNNGAAITVEYTDLSGLPKTFNFDLQP